eukprot:7074652-Pyramimonas_sp.AAC.1
MTARGAPWDAKHDIRGGRVGHRRSSFDASPGIGAQSGHNASDTVSTLTFGGTWGEIGEVSEASRRYSLAEVSVRVLRPRPLRPPSS